MNKSMLGVRASHWVPVELSKTIQRKHAKTPKRIQLHGLKHAVFWDADARAPMSVDDACVHRAASLATGSVSGGCVTCVYHGMKARGTELGDEHGILWKFHDTGKVPAEYELTPPKPDEFFMDNQRVFEYARDFSGCNPVLTVENTLDWSHLASVHAFHVIDGEPKVAVERGGFHGKAVYTYTSSHIDLVIENEYIGPWSSLLRFIIDGTQRFTLVFSVVPHDRTNCTLIVRVYRPADALGMLGDAMCTIINELPLWEDKCVVQHVDASKWSSNALTPKDAFLKEYRNYVGAMHPDILAMYTD